MGLIREESLELKPNWTLEYVSGQALTNFLLWQVWCIKKWIMDLLFNAFGNWIIDNKKKILWDGKFKGWQYIDQSKLQSVWLTLIFDARKSDHIQSSKFKPIRLFKKNKK